MVRASDCDSEGRGFDPRLSPQNPHYGILWTILRPPWTYRKWWFRLRFKIYRKGRIVWKIDERPPKEYSIREKIYWIQMFTQITEADMIDIERIEKAYNRFKLLFDHCHFKAVEMKQTEKDQHGKTISDTDKPVYEVRCNARFIYAFRGNGSESSAKDVVERLNKSLEEFIQEEYDTLLNEIKEAET